MNKTNLIFYKRYFIFFTIAVLLHLVSPVVFSQDKAINTIAAKFEDYSSRHLQEKLFLHTDKEFYVAGEIVWFKIYAVEGVFNKPLDISKVAYAEILDRDNKPVLQEKIQLENGTGDASFYLPLTLASGYYKLRSYTNWMKNFSPDFFFEKPITVVNTIKAPDNLPAADTAVYYAGFFPEGGNLVSNIESKVAYRITDQSGKGVMAKGFILRNNSDTVLSFQPSRFGIGNFVFQPSAGSSYKAILVFSSGKVIEQSLPAVNEKGYVMRVTNTGNGDIKVTINANTNSQNKEVALLAHTRQVVKFVEKVRLDNNGLATFIIDRSKLGEGISQITAFTEEGYPVCERLYFIKPVEKIRLSAKSDIDQYTTRKKVNLSVVAKDNAGETVPADISVAVFQPDSLQLNGSPDIFSYLWLSSDLKGQIESPGYYFSDDPGVREAADNLMLTHGWRRFRWTDVLAPEKSVMSFPPEYKGPIISAKIMNVRDNAPAINKQVFFSMPGKPFKFYSSSSDNNGIVWFDINDSYDDHDIIFQVNDRPGYSYRTELISPYADAYTGKSTAVFSPSVNIQDVLLNRSISMQVQNVYTADSMTKFSVPVIADSLPFFKHADRSYSLDDYKRFTTMEEVLREYIGEISVVVRNGKLHLKILNQADREFYDEDILVLIDGVALLDRDKIFSFDPLKVKKVDVITKGYVVGPSFFRGMVNFSTYDGGFKAGELDPNLVVVNYEGLQSQREFYSPVYETAQQQATRIPDFRNTLYWSPSLITTKKGETNVQFYTSDQKGIYKVIVQGMGKDGPAATASFTFEVK